ncbi:hypothetical protein GGI43DRAFT_429559 [Trichoderma evansii]
MAAARNVGCGYEVMETILNHGHNQLPVAESVIIAAAENKVRRYETMEAIFKYDENSVLITTSIFMAAANNISCGFEVMEVIFKHGKFHNILTEVVIESLTRLGDRGSEFMHLVGKYAGDDDELTSRLLINGFKYSKMNVHITKSLLKHRKKPSNTALIARSAASNLEHAGELVKLLFQYWWEQGIDVTDELLWAAIRNKGSGDSVLAFLFEQMQYEIKVPQSIINFVLSSEDGKQETPADLLIIVRYASAVEMRNRFQTCKAQQLSVTTAVVSAMLFNENRNEVMRELLCGSHQNIHVEVDAALSIVNKFGSSCTEYLLCHQHGLFFENEQVIKGDCSARHRYCRRKSP